MNDTAVSLFLESILGKGHYTSRGNMSFSCPFPDCPSVIKNKKKLEIQVNTNALKENPWHCWVCNNRGKTIKALTDRLKIKDKSKLEELNLCVTTGNYVKHSNNTSIELPKEFISLIDEEALKKLNKHQKILFNQATHFLKKRNLNNFDIIKYNIGFCVEGAFEKRIIIPSYDANGILNYFIARDFTDTLSEKYKNPPIDVKQAIGMELYINWDAPIILIEGMFDFLTVKRNTIPLFGKIIHEKLMKKLMESSVNKIYIALDPDAIKQAIKQAEILISHGKEVYLVEIDGKDANEIGFESFLNTLENTYPLDFQTILEKKLSLI